MFRERGLTPISGSLKFSLTGVEHGSHGSVRCEGTSNMSTCVNIRSKLLHTLGVHAVPGQIHLCRETTGLSVVLKSNDRFLHQVLVQGMNYATVRVHSHSFFASCSISLDGLHGCQAKSLETAHCTGLCTFLRGHVHQAYSIRPESIQHKNAIIRRIWRTESLILSAEFHQKSLLQNSALLLSVINPTSLSPTDPQSHTNHQGVSARDTPFLEAPSTSQKYYPRCRCPHWQLWSSCQACWMASNPTACHVWAHHPQSRSHHSPRHTRCEWGCVPASMAKLHIKKKHLQDIPECKSNLPMVSLQLPGKKQTWMILLKQWLLK